MADDPLSQASASTGASEPAAPATNGTGSPSDQVTQASTPSSNGPAPAAQPPGKAKQTAAPKDSSREIAETVVFVVVLVLLLKTFIAEAFVIPTGSMASTLWGYQKV